MSSWRQILLDFIKPNDLTDVYEFGVFTGKSMVELVDLYNGCNVPIRRLFGLDSFEGLPAETEEPPWQECWKKGEFDSRKHYDIKSSDEVMDYLYDMVDRVTLEETTLRMVKGFYEDVLNEDAVSKWDFKPAHYIDIDVDIYSSAKFVLDYVFENGIAVPETIIGYDDWGGSPGWQNFSNGESRAHKEAEEKFNIEFELLAQWGNAYPHVARIYKVKSIG